MKKADRDREIQHINKQILTHQKTIEGRSDMIKELVNRKREIEEAKLDRPDPVTFMWLGESEAKGRPGRLALTHLTIRPWWNDVPLNGHIIGMTIASGDDTGKKSPTFPVSRAGIDNLISKLQEWADWMDENLEENES